MEIKVNNASQALCEILRRVPIYSVEKKSRAGKVFEFPEPVIIHYKKPRERLIFFKERDFPTIFVLMESIWMMAGRNDVEWLSQFNKRMADYSDDGKIFHGAYGFRWRKSFDRDQLEVLVNLLKTRPNTRRAVLQMWDSKIDLHPDESLLDIPCNLLVKFQKRNNKLDMTVYNRSNDAIWGTTCANSTHFSILHEYISSRVGMEMGEYFQITDNLHVYEDVYKKYKFLANYAPDPYRKVPISPYEAGEISTKIVTNPESFIEECESFCLENAGLLSYRNEFFCNIAWPLQLVHGLWRKKSDADRFQKAGNVLHGMKHSDWKLAAQIWLDLRYQKHLEKESESGIWP